jgi:hypothetical protein
MSKQLYVLDTPDDQLAGSWIHLEDDLLDAVHVLTEADRAGASWQLFEDAYGDATFDPDRAGHLAVECEHLAASASRPAAIWLRAIAALARGVSAQRKCLRAFAD